MFLPMLQPIHWAKNKKKKKKKKSSPILLIKSLVKGFVVHKRYCETCYCFLKYINVVGYDEDEDESVMNYCPV